MKILVKTLTLLLGAAVATGAFAQSTIVQWGAAGGEFDIVTSNTPLNPFPTPTYAPNSDHNPDVGSDYYPSAAGRTPIFSAAGAYDNGDGDLNRFLWARQIQDNAPNGDRIRLEGQNANPNGGSIFTHGMVVWDDEDWLSSTDDTLDTLTVEAFRSNPEPGVSAGAGRFIIENDAGWFASDELPLAPGFQNQSSDVGSLSWFDFSPMIDGIVTIGSGATPSFAGVSSVGYYFETSTDTASNLGAFIRHFQATAASGSTCIEPIPGDFDCDGIVAAGDLNLVLNNWGQPATPVPDGWINDLPEGTISAEELNGVLNNWGNTVPMAVPEPAGTSLMLAGLILFLRRR